MPVQRGQRFATKRLLIFEPDRFKETVMGQQRQARRGVGHIQAGNPLPRLQSSLYPLIGAQHPLLGMLNKSFQPEQAGPAGPAFTKVGGKLVQFGHLSLVLASTLSPLLCNSSSISRSISSRGILTCA